MDEILSYRQYVRPFYVMAKPAGARCNLRCTYCYYLEKSSLYPAAPAQTMSDELLERFIRDYIAAQAGDAVSFAWHGGETLLRSRDFYRRVVELQRRYADGRQIDNSIQTYVLSDHSKFGKVTSVTFAQLNRGQIITDRLPDKTYSSYTSIKEVM